MGNRRKPDSLSGLSGFGSDEAGNQ